MLGSRATLELEPSYFKIFSIRSSILAILANLIVNHVHQVAMPALRRLLFSSPTLYSPTQRPAVYLNVAVPHGTRQGTQCWETNYTFQLL
jgi:hypothetical protein